MSAALINPFEDESAAEGAPAAVVTEAQDRRQKQKKQSVEEMHAQAMRDMLNTTQGRSLFAFWVLQLAQINETSARADYSSEPMLFREGARKMGLTMQEQALRHARSQYMVLLSEHLPKP